MRQTLDYPSLSSYIVTVSADLFAGYTLLAATDCTVKVGQATPNLPYTLLAGDVLNVTHTATSNRVSNLRLQTPGDEASGAVLGVMSIARLSATTRATPSVQGNGGSSGLRTVNATLLTVNFTVSQFLNAEGIVMEMEGLSAASVTDAAVVNTDGNALAYGVGNVDVTSSPGQCLVTFGHVAYLPPGSYSYYLRFAAGTRLDLTSNPVLGNGTTSFNIDGNPNYAPARVSLMGGPATTLGALDLYGMRVVKTPTDAPGWANGAVEIVAPDGAAPYLRTRSGGIDYTLAFTPVSSGGGGGGQDA